MKIIYEKSQIDNIISPKNSKNFHTVQHSGMLLIQKKQSFSYSAIHQLHQYNLLCRTPDIVHHTTKFRRIEKEEKKEKEEMSIEKTLPTFSLNI